MNNEERIKDIVEIEDAIKDLISTTEKGNDEGEIMRIGAKFSLQVDIEQQKMLDCLLTIASECDKEVFIFLQKWGEVHFDLYYLSKQLKNIVNVYKEHKSYNLSNEFIQRLGEAAALQKFIGQGLSFSVNKNV